MNIPLPVLTLLLVSGLTACHKQSPPAQADMDAETRQKAVEVRAAADKKAAALNESATVQTKEAPPPTPAPLK
ncbi:MAG: hypothetical protein J0L73_04530 [Verrucomicrobia bacterium]|nr:hypothetical protein [Verrucomicrobiota bacterium]